MLTVSGMGPVTSNTIYGFRSDVMLSLLSLYARTQHPTATDLQIKQLVPLLLTQLHEKMNLGDTSVRPLNIASSAQKIYF